MSLGRGLSSLIPEKKDGKTLSGVSFGDVKNAVLDIDISKIEPNPYQPRKFFKQDALEDLASSIKEHGVLQPIVVSESKDGSGRYQIIAGERRFRASKLAGMNTIPAILQNNKTDKEKLELAILENVQREDLTPLEKAISYKQLSDDFGMTHESIGKRVGKSRAVISNTIRLLDLPDEVKEALEKGEISENHARAILSLPKGPMQVRLLNEIKLNKLSAKKSEVAARAILKRPVKSMMTQDPFVKEILSKLESSLGTKVTLNPKKHVSDGGDIVIKYFSNEDLKNILRKMLKD